MPSTTPSVAPTQSATVSTAPPVAATPSVEASASADVGWQLVAIGDSIPFGQFDCGGCPAFPQLFGAWVETTTGIPVQVKNLSSHAGLTTPGLLERLTTSNTYTDAIREAEIITVTIGHNDVPWGALDDGCDGANGFFDGNADASWQVLVGPCLQPEVDRYRRNLDAVLIAVLATREGQPTVIRFTNQYADIPGDPCCPPEATEVSTTIKDAFNKAACEVATTHDIPCIDVYHAFNGPDGSEDAGELLAQDHTHPSALGQQKIAELLEAAGLSPLR